MTPVEQFWDQYNENLRNRPRLFKRLARLVFAFVMALLIGSVCYGVEWLTGSRAAVLVVGLLLAAVAVVIWWAIAWIFDSRPIRSDVSPVENPVILAEPVCPPPFASPPAKQVVHVATPPSKSTHGGVVAALLGLFCVFALSCCGGVTMIGVILSRLGKVAPAEVDGGQPFASPVRPPSVRSDSMRGAFETAQRRQQKIEDTIHRQQRQIEDSIRRQEEQIREMERRHSPFQP